MQLRILRTHKRKMPTSVGGIVERVPCDTFQFLNDLGKWEDVEVVDGGDVVEHDEIDKILREDRSNVPLASLRKSFWAGIVDRFNWEWVVILSSLAVKQRTQYENVGQLKTEGLSVGVDVVRVGSFLYFFPHKDPRYDEVIRVSGDGICQNCFLGFQYHPEFETTFHVLCDGRTVKL